MERDQEGIRQAAQALLENRWIMRSQMPDEYFLVRRYERPLRDYFQEKCGWPLLVNAQFYKLEKIPARPRAFMGIEAMQSVGDYTLLCCVLAFLEDQEVDGQFLLGDLCEALLGYYPQEKAVERLNWESYTWRKALIRPELGAICGTILVFAFFLDGYAMSNLDGIFADVAFVCDFSRG